MDFWALIFLSLSLSLGIAFKLLLHLTTTGAKKRRLPPGPLAVPILGNLLWLKFSPSNIEPLLRDLRATYGPILTLHVGSRPTIFICDRDVAHKALIQHGAVFANRPPALPATRFLSSNQHNINSAPYGPLWRLLRRNLMSEILHPSRVKLFGHGREWVLNILMDRLRAQSESDNGVVVAMDAFQYAMFCLLVLMCFGEKLDDKIIGEIESSQRALLVNVRKFNVFAFAPRLTKLLFRKRWESMLEMRRRQKNVIIPLVRNRQQQKEERQHGDQSFHYSYVDSLLDLELAEENGRKVNDDEMMTLCSEFLNAGTDTTSTALQWIMANVVKHPHVQAKLWEEIRGVAGEREGEIREEDLQRMPYLKAVVLEGLRRHPPAHFVLPHSVTEEITIEGYLIPKNATVNFMVAEMGWDGKVWEEPLEFKPERFQAGGEGEGVDITGSREIKMMPFGVGRRICPGLSLAMLHLEYFVANLVKEFEWKAVDGEEIDLSEKTEFTVVMKNPLRARILARGK